MRLTDPQMELIRAGALARFGGAARIWLFGSRADDGARGGDIDLYIEPEIQEPDRLVDAKLEFLADLHRALGERRIDLVIRRESRAEDLPIYRVARETGVRLA